MKTIKIAAALVLTMFLSGQVMAQDQKEQLVVPLSDPGKPFKLNIGLINGGIKVTTYEGKDVIIDVTIEKEDRKGDRKENAGGMKRITAGNGMDVSAEEKNNRITVHSESWKGNVNFVVKVPQTEATLKLSTINNGDISVTGVNGEIEVTNVNGAVTLTNVSGSVVANTINGDLKATLKSIDPKAPMAFSTLNGNVDVTFPSTLKVNVKLKSDMGEMFTDFDIEADKNQPTVKKTNQAGMYRVNIESWVYGKINGGGPELMMKNMNGNIYIRKAKS